MQVIPIIAAPTQTLRATLGGQDCAITIRQLTTGLFFYLSVSGTNIVAAMICLDRVGLVRNPYLGFVGQLMFVDTAGFSDPYYSGLGDRYILTYTE
jgi:hypothetical protein